MKNIAEYATRLLYISFLIVSLFFVASCDGSDNENPEYFGLPQVYITTPSSMPIASKVDWVEGGNIRIVNSYGKEVVNEISDFRGRGNSTWGMPKKPYAIKLDKRKKVLGMPDHKRWVLLANWMDRTLMRNAVAFEISRCCMGYTPRGQFVELYVNDVHKGNYYLCEQIKIDRNRLNISEIKSSSPLTADNLTGGYLLEFDTYATEDPLHFVTKINNYAVAIKDPDEDIITDTNHPAYIYIKEYVDNLEAAFERDDYAAVCNLIDIESFIDSWLVYNLTLNREPAHPKSFYMHKKRNGKLYAGPLWDFDCATFIPGETKAILQGVFYYRYLFRSAEFKQAVKKRWLKLKPSFEKIPEYIDETADCIAESNAVNSVMWPITISVNGDEKLSFEDAVARMRTAYIERLNVLDNVIMAY